MRQRSLASLGFLIFQLVTATLFLRPAELFSWLNGVPLYEILIITTLLILATSLEPHFHLRAMMRQPITLCATLLFPSVILSHLSHVYLGGARDSAELFGKTLLYYGLVITAVNSPRRLRAFLLNVALCTGTMVTLCLFDYWSWWDFEFIVHLEDLLDWDDEGAPIFIHRMRGTGIFQDPNDLAMVIVAGGLLCTYFLTEKSFGNWRIFWFAPLVIFAAALMETHSRGGLLAALSAGMTLLCFRYGTKFTIVVGVLAVCMLPLIAGRSGDIDLSDGSTGHERVLMWREGFDALKSPELLFGIGQGMYADLAGLVAHNSFVHAYVELGVVGGTLFFGCFFFAAMQIYRIGRLPQPVWHPDLVRLRPYISAVLVGWCVSMMSLSRCYVVPTFLILGMTAAYLNLVWIHTPLGRPLVIWNRWQMLKLTTASAAMFVCLYLFTVIFT